MPVNAVHQIRKMRGGSQSHLILCDDDSLYVVKFRNNPQGVRILANEFLATKLARAIGLNAPPCEIVEVDEWLISKTPGLTMELRNGSEPCDAGLHFGSRVPGGLMPGLMFDYLDDQSLQKVTNLKEFAGMLALDKWTSNKDSRQAVFIRKMNGNRFAAHFIDFGFCFNAGSWNFHDAPLQGIYMRESVYQDVTGWESFQPWLQRIESFDPQTLYALASEIPSEWYGGETNAMDKLVRLLVARRGAVREKILDLAIAQYNSGQRSLFSQWQSPRLS